MIADFSMSLRIDLGVAIGRRESFDATIDLETIFAQNIDFLDVAIDEKDDTLFERSRTISDTNMKKDKSFDDVRDVADDSTIEKDDEEDDEKNDETEEINDETDDSEICAESETIVFDFFACRMRICS